LNAFSALAVLKLHTGVCFAMMFVLILMNLSYRRLLKSKEEQQQETYKTTYNARTGIVLLSIIIGLLFGAQTVLYVKEWQLRVSQDATFTAKLSLPAYISQMAQLVWKNAPPRTFTDTSKLLILPILQLLSFYFVHETKARGINPRAE
jgi:predicted permease